MIDFEKTSEKFNLPPNSYHSFNLDNNKVILEHNGSSIEIDESECVVYEEGMFKLRIQETGYQRRGMKDGFSKVLNGGYFLLTEEELLHMKLYCGEEYDFSTDEINGFYPLKTWELNENEFIEFDW